MKPHCNVPGCSMRERFDKTHRLRLNSKRYEEWLRLVGRLDIMENPRKLRNFRICSRHFSEEQKYESKRRNRTNLKADAIPDRYLPASEEIQTQPMAEEIVDTSSNPNANNEVMVIYLGNIGRILRTNYIVIHTKRSS